LGSKAILVVDLEKRETTKSYLVEFIGTNTKEMHKHVTAEELEHRKKKLLARLSPRTTLEI